MVRSPVEHALSVLVLPFHCRLIALPLRVRLRCSQPPLLVFLLCLAMMEALLVSRQCSIASCAIAFPSLDDTPQMCASKSTPSSSSFEGAVFGSSSGLRALVHLRFWKYLTELTILTVYLVVSNGCKYGRSDSRCCFGFRVSWWWCFRFGLAKRNNFDPEASTTSNSSLTLQLHVPW